MKNKKGLVLSALIALFIIGVSIPLFMTTHKKVKAETITDLSNTNWLLNDTRLDFWISNYGEDWDFNINFTSNNNNYSNINCNTSVEEGMNFYELKYDLTSVYDGDSVNASWHNIAYRTISITGGNDATNSSFISWLQNNATQQTPSPTGSQITSRYWAPDGVITMQDNQRIGDEDIQYKILFNEFTDTYTDTTQTGLYFLGLQTNQEPQWSYIESINGDGINLLYHGTTNNINNTMWLEFTIGDYMDTDLYNLMDTLGTWFDDSSAYLVGMNQGYVEGKEIGRALGQADGVEYTNIITRIFNGLGDILTIQVFPNITIALIIGLPLLLGVFIIIIKILRG